MKPDTLKVALIGCGKIADQHVQAIRRVAGAVVVAVCDQELLMARQLGERFGIKDCFADSGEMLHTIKPQVVHITAPPQAHLALGRQCLAAGCHIYLEKPFAINTADALELFKLADSLGLKITAGHNFQFTLEMLEMRRLVAENYLGGPPVHLESYWPYNLTDASYARPILGSTSHWVRQLPGQLYHNVISHGIARFAEFLDDEIVQLTACSRQSPQLADLWGGDVQDELRVFLRDKKGVTAFFCFSTQIKPGLNMLRILGPAKSLVVDQSSGCLLRQETCASKSYLTFILPPLNHARQHFHNAWTNFKHIICGRLYQDGGMKELTGRFYASIRHGAPPPLPAREIILTTKIMDEIFKQVYPHQSLAAPVKPENRKTAVSSDGRR